MSDFGRGTLSEDDFLWVKISFENAAFFWLLFFLMSHLVTKTNGSHFKKTKS